MEQQVAVECSLRRATGYKRYMCHICSKFSNGKDSYHYYASFLSFLLTLHNNSLAKPLSSFWTRNISTSSGTFYCFRTNLPEKKRFCRVRFHSTRDESKLVCKILILDEYYRNVGDPSWYMYPLISLKMFGGSSGRVSLENSTQLNSGKIILSILQLNEQDWNVACKAQRWVMVDMTKLCYEEVFCIGKVWLQESFGDRNISGYFEKAWYSYNQIVRTCFFQKVGVIKR